MTANLITPDEVLDAVFGKGKISRAEHAKRFSPDKEPYERWSGLNIQAPKMPLNLDHLKEDTVGHPQSPALEMVRVTQICNVTPSENANPIYISMGGGEGTFRSLLASQILENKFQSEDPNLQRLLDTMTTPVPLDFEATRRDLICAFANRDPVLKDKDHFDTQTGHILDPRLRDWVRYSTNLTESAAVVNLLGMGRNVVMDWPAASVPAQQFDGFRKLVHDRSGKDVKVVLIGTTTSLTKDAISQYQQRAFETGQYMPVPQVLANLAGFSKNFKDATAAADEVYLLNMDGLTPRLIAKKTGRNGKLQILYPGDFEEFQAQGDLNVQAQNWRSLFPPINPSTPAPGGMG